MSACPVCGEFSDYCQGHGEIGDPFGSGLLALHEDGDHTACHPRADCSDDDTMECGCSEGMCYCERFDSVYGDDSPLSHGTFGFLYPDE